MQITSAIVPWLSGKGQTPVLSTGAPRGHRRRGHLCGISIIMCDASHWESQSSNRMKETKIKVCQTIRDLHVGGTYRRGIRV
ncbi:hypothetical protein B0H12DRAFT_1134883 [Mycena haematopus]|nr:hypothetical protein B0H12DRAFT_1134883 [Mycena haematopus]